MRTTLTLDDDVAVLVRREIKRRNASLKQVINDALRQGLDQRARAAPEQPVFRVTPWNLGGSLVGSLDNVEEVLSRVEGERHR